MARQVVVVFLCLFAAEFAVSQSNNYQPVGIPSNTTLIQVPLGFVEPLTNQVHLEIPISKFPLRGGASVTAKLVYDTTIYSATSNQGIYLGAPGYGWHLEYGKEGSGTFLYDSPPSSGPCPDPAYPYGGVGYHSNFRFRDVHGTIHPMAWYGSIQIINCTDIQGNRDPNHGSPDTAHAVSEDGSGYTFDIAVYDNGVNNDFKAKVWSINGDIVTTLNSSDVATDTNGNYGGQYTQSPVTFSPARGCFQNSTSPFYIYVHPSDGSTQTYRANCAIYSVSEQGSGQNHSPGSVTLISSLMLPDGSQYSFTYDSGNSGNHKGMLTSVTLPTGGQLQFGYIYSVIFYGAKASLNTVSLGGGTWNFSSTTSGTGTNTQLITTVTGPSRYDAASQTNIRDKSVYTSTKGGPPWYLSTAQYYNGSSTLLKTVTTTYTGTLGGCQNAVTTTLNDTGQTSKVQYSYSPIGGRTACSLLTQKQEFDFGAGTPTRTTKITYIGDTASIHYNSQYYIYNRPVSVNVYAGSGTGSPVSSTTYTYDEYSANYCKNGVAMLTSTPGAINHDDSGHGSSFLARANVTSVSRWVSGSTWLTSHMCYDTLGNVTQEVDEQGSPTTYSYSENWADSACVAAGTNTRAFPTTVTDALGHSATTKYFSCTGLPQAVADQNDITAGRNGTAATYDWANRPVSTTDQVGAPTNCTYTTNTSECALLFNGNASAVDKLTTIDSLGRLSLEQTRQAPGSTSFDTVAHSYDFLSRESSIGLPCVSTANVPCASAATSKAYDALGRPTLITDGGGGTTSYTYSGRDALQSFGPAPSGEQPKRKQLEYDALGRLLSVCEITSGTASWPGGSCGQTAPATGYRTAYLYDVLDNLTTVSQSAQSRSYAYDGIGRLTSESNPENGSFTYVYDNDSNCGSSNDDLVKRADAAGNIACYSYDALHRPTLITYPSGPAAGVTPAKYFVYDAPYNNSPGLNLAGRLSAAGTCQQNTSCAGNSVVAQQFSYSPRGELADVWQSSPNSGGTYHVPMTYWENGLLHTISWLNQGQTTYIPDGEGRVYSLNNTKLHGTTYNAASQPTQLLTSCTGGYATCYPITYNYEPDTGRMSSYSAALNGGTISGALTWNPNGSLGQLITADPFNAADNQTCNYSADDLGRLASVNCTGSAWSQTFSYDPFGNITKNGSITWNPGYNTSLNHYTLAGTTYDGNGNVTNDTFNAYTWDADGKPLSRHILPSGQTWTFTNDAFGHMVELAVNGVYSMSYLTLGKFRLSAQGQSAHYSEYPLPGGSVFSNGGGATGIQLADWLGSIRAFYSYTGGNYSRSSAHAPFGETYSLVGVYPWGFAGQGTGGVHGSDGNASNTTYWFPERWYRSNQGRWLQPDPAGLDAADPTDPQSWNRYPYVGNRPLTNVDPDGLDCVYLSDTADKVDDIDHNSQQGECWEHGGYWADGYVGGNNWIMLNPNGDNILINSSVNGFLATTIAGSTANGGVAFSQMFPLNVDLSDIVDNSQGIGHLSPHAQEYAQAIHDKFANFPNICSVTASLNFGASTGRMRVGVEYNTSRGVAVRGRAQGGIGPVKARVTVNTNGRISTSVRVGGTLGATLGFSGRNVTSVGVSANLTKFASVGLSGQVEPFYSCQ